MSNFGKFSDGDTRVDTNLVNTKPTEIVDEIILKHILCFYRETVRETVRRYSLIK